MSNALLAAGALPLVVPSRLAPGAYADAADVVATLAPEAPLFLFSAAALRQRIDRFLTGFPGLVTYAVKANPSPDVLLTLAGAGLMTYDVASVEEMATVRRVAPHAQLHYHNPVKSRAEIAQAYRDYGCRRFAADTAREIEKIVEGTAGDRGVEIAVRFRLAREAVSVHDFSSKFGASPEDAARLLRLVGKLGPAPMLTFHPGSQCTDADAFRRHILAAAEIARAARIRIGRLNVGGGFPAGYATSAAPDLSTFFAAIVDAMREAFGGLDRPRIECEPGRGLVATSTSLLTRVKLVRAERREVFLNDGIYGGLMEAYQAPKLMPNARPIRSAGAFATQSAEFTVFGPTCDPLDRMPLALRLPVDIAEDDYVEFGPLGAYGAATSTRFNGYGAGETVHVREAFAD